MAKRYTAAEWARIQSRLPEEDRVPYSESPDAPTPQQLAATTLPTVFAATSRARTSSNAASGAIGNAQAALGDYYANQAAATAAAAKALLSTSTTATTAAVTPTTATAATVTATTATTPTVVATTATTPTVVATTATTPTVVATTATATVVATTATAASARSAVGTYVDPETGDVYILYSDSTRELAAKGTKASDAAAAAAAATAAQEAAAKAALEAKRAAGQSAFDFLREQFSQYGLEGLLGDVEKYIKDGLSPAEFTLRLRTESDAYKRRFAANQARIQKGLRALSEAEYIGLEDQYQNIMRNYGLPESYYTRGEMGRQEGFEKFIAGDVSAAELEDRIQTAQNRVINAAPEVSRALRQFYPGITNGDILAYALDPDKALTDIRRKVTAAEIGAGAMQAGLATDITRAEELGAFGVTGERARAGYQTVADILPTAQKLSDIYRKQGLGAYNQATAEQEVFGITGAAESGRKRRKLSELEQASFSGQAGITGGALGRERAGQF